MLLAGDELGHTQNGNNNAYCQDNELTWLDWDLDERPEGASSTSSSSVMPRSGGAAGLPAPASSSRAARIRGSDIKDISWLEPDGQGDDRRGLERRLRQVPGRAAGGRPDRRRGRARRADRRRHAADPAQRPPRADPVHLAADDRRARSGSVSWTPRRATPNPIPRGGEAFDLRDRSLSSSSRATRPRPRQPVSTAEVERLRREARRPEPPVPPAQGGPAAGGLMPPHDAPMYSQQRGPADAAGREGLVATVVDNSRASRNAGSTWRLTPGNCSPRPARASRRRQVGARIDLPPPVPRRLHLPRRRRDRPLPARPRHHPLLRLAVPQGRGRAARTATTSSTTAAQPRDRHRGRLRAWRRRLREHGLGLILDIVPNHMGIVGNENPWWNDVLENGPASPLRRPLRHRLVGLDPARELQGRCCCRSWATPTARCSSGASCSSVSTAAAFHVQYFEHRFPVDPQSYGRSSSTGVDELGKRPWVPSTTPSLEYPEHPDRRPQPAGRTETEPGQRGRAAAREGGHQAPARGPARRAARRAEAVVEQTVAAVQRQARRPAQLRPARRAARPRSATGWPTGGSPPDEINYRRFFDVNDLAALASSARTSSRPRTP